MKSKDKKNEVPTNFPDIETVEGLKLYLDDMASRLFVSLHNSFQCD